MRKGTTRVSRSKYFNGTGLVEPLEKRQLMAVTLGTNIIANPGAESSATTPTGWTANGAPTVVAYGASGFPTSTSPGPSSRGKNFFAGGGGSESDLFQTIDVSSLGSSIDAGQIKFALQGYLGGFSSQADQASVFLNYQTASKTFVSQVSIGPVTPANRGNVTGLLLKTLNGSIPKTTRFIQAQIHFEALSGGFDDGYADELSLKLTSSSTGTTGGIAGTVFNDANGDGVKGSTETGLGGVKVFVDKNKNGVLDSGEPSATTTSSGAYGFTGLAAGSYAVREVVPATFRATTANPLTATVVAGSTLTGKNFGDSQTAVISGVAFNDTNGNKIQDSTEKGIAGVTVYLDFNNNGQLDSFELKTTTDASGKYSFIVPFGTYVVRQVKPTGKTQTTPSTSFSVTLIKAQISTGKNFGDK